MLEFTGERVVPGLVEAHLLNEHLARYRFAARYAAGKAVLDAGCGSGYGSSELRAAASVTAMDIAHDAVLHAAASYGRPGLHFAQGRLEALPFADASFDLVVAFEVIEHLEHWEDLLREARRVLRPSGVLLVSTPNKSYYAESRGTAGANPFHAHEFEYEEFRAALNDVFPHVRLWSQNRTEAIVFAPVEASFGTVDAPGDTTPELAHFYLAACSAEPIPAIDAFAWLPTAGNLLREREHHIELLFEEIERKNVFAQELQESRAQLMRSYAALEQELEAAHGWAADLDGQLRQAGARIEALQNELAAAHSGYGERIRALDEEAARRLAWVADLESQIEIGNAEIERQREERKELVQAIEERSAWAHRLDEELQLEKQEQARLRGILREVAESRWLRTGRALHLGPVIETATTEKE